MCSTGRRAPPPARLRPINREASQCAVRQTSHKRKVLLAPAHMSATHKTCRTRDEKTHCYAYLRHRGSTTACCCHGLETASSGELRRPTAPTRNAISGVLPGQLSPTIILQCIDRHAPTWGTKLFKYIMEADTDSSTLRVAAQELAAPTLGLPPHVLAGRSCECTRAAWCNLRNDLPDDAIAIQGNMWQTLDLARAKRQGERWPERRCERSRNCSRM